MRRLLLVVLCFGLALQAPAARALVPSPCPMEDSMRAMVAAGALDPADLPDCCNDPQTFAATGQLCKAGADCGSTPPAAAFGLAPIIGRVATASAAPPAGPAPAHTTTVAPPWRPPAGP